MKKQAARTITTLSLFIALSVNASNVFAFPSNCTRSCQPPVQYAASTPVQTANATPAPATAPDATLTEAQPESSAGLIALFWAPLVTIFASLI